MQAALKYYRQVHSEYLWLHFLVAVVLVFTSVFWFVLPYFMINYGNYSTTAFQQLLILIALYTVPSFIVTMHCWFINFKAALRWKKSYPEESVWRWFLKFQSITFLTVVLFSSVIFSSLFIIDMVL
ncbi:hypothetical protein ACTHOQ_05520 [Solibacillus silvestris]|uniref:hypothetical protein n=1 Tax=Solibacillus silvestris TaxID=76853 RepID=UPI003F803F62